MRTDSTHRRARAIVLAALGIFLIGSTSAQAALTAPTSTVYRGDVPFNEDTGGRHRSNLAPGDVTGPTGTPATQTQLDQTVGTYFLGFGLSCLSVSTGTSNSTNPLRTVPAADKTSQSYVQITRDSDNQVVFTQNHLSNQNTPLIPSASDPPLPDKPQPYGGTWTTAGAPAGFYTARSYKRDITRGNPAIAVLPTDSSATRLSKRNPVATCGINGPGGTAPTNVQVSEVKFEYRPWEQRFKDTLQTAGGVDFNLNSSREFQISLRGNRQSAIKNAPQAFTVVKLPTNADVVLPSDPTVCLPDPEACLPPTPTECQAASACKDRLVMIDYRADGAKDSLLGIFDLQSRAFVAVATVGDNFSVLKSAGSLDPQIQALKGQLATQAAKLGIGFSQLSAMKVSSVSGGKETKLSLDEGLEQLVSTGMINGTTVQGGPAVNAGVVVHLIGGGYKRAPGTAGTDPGPYKVYGSAMTAPAVPTATVPALPAPVTEYGPLVQGLIQTGGLGLRQVQAKGYTGGQHIYALAAGIEPSVAKLLYIPGDVASFTDKSVDFVGVPLVITQGGLCNAAGDCVGIGFLTGAGAALYDSPVAIPPLFAP